MLIRPIAAPRRTMPGSIFDEVKGGSSDTVGGVRVWSFFLALFWQF
jgi:hypothetical protein